MKTEFERISEIMYTLLEHQPVIDVPYEKINDIAVALVKEGYGKTSEYKAEIERLKSNNGFLQCVISHSKDIMDEAVKQAQIDVLTELRNKCHNYYPSIDHYCCSVKAVNLSDINKMIEELEK